MPLQRVQAVSVTVLVSLAAVLPRLGVAYPTLGAYMPATNVLEHAQISLDAAKFSEALKGEPPDYTLALSIYEKGGGESCKSPSKTRKLGDFATKDLTGETFFDAFAASGFAVDFWDTWLRAGLAGTGVFAGLSRTKRVTCLKKGVFGLMMRYASHELELGIVKAQANNSGDATHVWDEGWAFYYGAEADGKGTPWEAGKKRDGDFPDGLQVHTDIVPQFSRGLIAMRTEPFELVAAQEARDTIYKMWAVGCLRAALKYLELAERTYDEKAHAEAYSYYYGIDGWINSKSATAAERMRSSVAITQTTIAAGTFCAAKLAMEAAYSVIGINCSMVGTFSGTSINCTTPCTDSAAPLAEGADAIAEVAGTATDTTCLVDHKPKEDPPSASSAPLGQGLARPVALLVGAVTTAAVLVATTAEVRVG